MKDSTCNVVLRPQLTKACVSLRGKEVKYQPREAKKLSVLGLDDNNPLMVQAFHNGEN